MTHEELIEMGIEFVADKFGYENQSLFYMRKLDIEFYLTKPFTIQSVFQAIYHTGYLKGVDKGKAMKISEIKTALDIE